MDYSKYKERQQKIISGEYPLTRITDHELRRLLAKALYNFDKSVADLVTNELIRRNVRIERYTGPYSKRQKAFINGETPITSASLQELKIAHKTARALCDKDSAELFENELKRRIPYLTDIDGYSAAQTILILGLKPIEEAHDGAVTALANMAEYLCDMDIAEYANTEEDRRGLKKRRVNKRTLGMEAILLQTDDFLNASDLELCQAAFDAYRLDSPILDTIEDIVEERVLKAHKAYYSDHEEELIKGERELIDETLSELEQLYHKAQHDEKLLRTQFFNNLEEHFKRMESEWRKKKEQREDYNDRQMSILQGEHVSPPSIRELRAIVNKAERRGDVKIAEFFKTLIAEREEQMDPNSGYNDLQQMLIGQLREKVIPRKVTLTETKRRPRRETLSSVVKNYRDDAYYDGIAYSPYKKKELQIIDREIPLSACTRKKLGNLIRKARKHGDDHIADWIEAHLRERNDVSMFDERRIVSGEMAYEEISTAQLKSLLKKAKKKGDQEVIELVETLLYEKSSDRKTRIRSIGGSSERRVKDTDWAGIIEKLQDMGRDIIATKGKDVHIVQCKFWSKEKTIHEKHVFQLFGTAVSYRLEHKDEDIKITPVFVTNINLSPVAKKVAQYLHVTVFENYPMQEYPRIKCNVGKDEYGNKTKIYHLPMDQQYDSVIIDPKKNEFKAMTVAEAEAAGFRRAGKWFGQ